MTQTVEERRGFALLHRALGPEVLQLREDPSVVDILVRPWGISVDRLGSGLLPTGVVPNPGSIEMVIRTVRSIVGGTVTEDDPTVEHLDAPAHARRDLPVVADDHDGHPDDRGQVDLLAAANACFGTTEWPATFRPPRPASSLSP